MKFESPQALQQWLAMQALPLHRWGRGTAKTVTHLWNELQQGESELQEDPVLRLTTVVVVWIRRGQTCLLERSQEWSDGRIRPRNGPPSDKLHPGESWHAGALRCLWEEVAIDEAAVTLLDQVPREYWHDRESTSYPGLWCRYHSYHVDVTVAGLPDRPFRTAERDPSPSDPVRFHTWAWGRCDVSGSPI